MEKVEEEESIVSFHSPLSFKLSTEPRKWPRLITSPERGPGTMEGDRSVLGPLDR